jgi:dihydroorotate dehydrogenase electron transfer subunit
MKAVQAQVKSHRKLCGKYRLLVLEAPSIASYAKPGQFVHLRVPGLEDAVLRRPFSIYRAKGRSLSILYKQVGRGTATMNQIVNGDKISMIGPLGNGFPLLHGDAFPVLVAGGYGVAPLLFLAERMKKKGIIFIGGASAEDVLCASEFKRIGWEVRIATDDGSLGKKGLVTNVLDSWLSTDKKKSRLLEFYACGPDGMLKAVGKRAVKNGWKAWLSLDKHMGCGVGACLTCVQRIRTDDGHPTWARVCRDGPVFESRQIIWDK